MNLIPLEDHILVEAVEQEETTASGILLPTDKNEKPSKGKVVAVGSGKILENGQRAPIDVAVGDTVYFTKYAPDEIEVADDKKFLVVKHSSILAKEEK